VYILVCIDYVTKWVEAKALPKATEQAVADLLFDDIFVWFSVPREIVTDQGTQFTSKLIQLITKQYKIKHKLPRHIIHKLMAKLKSLIKSWKLF